MWMESRGTSAIIISCTMLVMLSSLTPFPINLCRYMKYLALGGVHPHLQTSYLQLALSDIMSLLLNNSFWAKTVTHSMDLLHVHGLLLHASHLLPLQYGSGTVHIHNTEQLLLATDCGILHGLSHVCHQHLLGPHRHQVVHHYLFVPLCTGIYFTSFFLPLLLGTRTFLILATLLEPSPTSITFVIISPCPWAP